MKHSNLQNQESSPVGRASNQGTTWFRKSLSRVALFLLAAFFFGMTANATVYHVTVQNFSFTPSSMTVAVGDVVEFDWVNGVHTTTSVSVPGGALTWDSPMNSSTQIFSYPVTAAGSYSYHCSIHPTLMMGSFTAVDCTPIVNIPDSIFKALLVGDPSINTNGDGEIQLCEAAAFTGTINANNLGISDLTGIEAFTALTTLYCGNNNLTSINVSQNTALNWLTCSGNFLSSLDISHNTALTYLDCSGNLLSS